MKAKIILALFLLLIGLGDINEHYLVCAAADAELLPISYTDKEIGKDKKADKELQPISYTDEEIGKARKSSLRRRNRRTVIKQPAGNQW